MQVPVQTSAIRPDQAMQRPIEELDSVVIRFVGDSGDGMQLTGTGFSMAVATTSPPTRITRPRYARQPARCSAYPDIRSNTRHPKCLLPATRLTFLLR